MAATILIIEDRKSQSFFLKQQFEELGYEVLTAETGKEGLGLFLTHEVDVVLLDWKLPDTRGLEVLQEIRKDDDLVPVIMMTAFAEVDVAVDAMQMGAFEYLRKPVDLGELQRVVERALETLAMKRELRRLQAGGRASTGDWIVGNNPEMKRVARVVERVAPTDASVLIEGESGTGKEVVAREIHRRSHRSHRPFVAINCAAIPDQLLESELFGFEAGAFTGARRQKKGLLETADGGTVFLDEIASMPLDMQAKILRVLEDKTLRRVGGNTDIRVDVRFISASNRSLARAIEEGKFREDLYWRLSVIPIRLIPLRERKSDIGLFVAAFIEHFNQTTGKNIRGISGEALELMRAYHWPGNIRELRNVIERAVILCDGDEIRVNHLPTEIASLQVHAAAKPAEEPTPVSPPSPAPAPLTPAVARRYPSFDQQTRKMLRESLRALPVGPEGPPEVDRFAESPVDVQAQVLRALIQDGQDYHCLWLAAELLASLLETPARVDALQEAFREDPGELASFLLALGLAYEGMGDYASALDYFLQTLALQPQCPFAYYDLGWVQRQLGRHADAAQSLSKALELRPNYVDAYNELGITYMEQGDPLRALTAFESAMALEPDNPHHYFNVGCVQKLLGDFDAAATTFARALELAPGYEEAAAQLRTVEKARSLPQLEVLDRIPFFKELPLEQRLLVCERLESVSSGEGEVVIRQGDPGDAFYIVEEGRLEVSIAGPRGDEVVVRQLERGHYFGEIALMDEGARRTATVRAVTPVRLLRLSREQFERISAEIPSVAQNLVQTRNERLRQDVLRTLEGDRSGPARTVALEPQQVQAEGAETSSPQFSVLTAAVLLSTPSGQVSGGRAPLQFLKEFFVEMMNVIGDRGVVRQYTGDRMVALFETAEAAVAAAGDMRETFARLVDRWKGNLPAIPRLAMGIATGPLDPEAGEQAGPVVALSLALCQACQEDGIPLADETTAQAVAHTPLAQRLARIPEPLRV
ncbi:MAG: sigma 54-interacting transcriptional regulator, partial [Anaerolineae bacterium]